MCHHFLSSTLSQTLFSSSHISSTHHHVSARPQLNHIVHQLNDVNHRDATFSCQQEHKDAYHHYHSRSTNATTKKKMSISSPAPKPLPPLVTSDPRLFYTINVSGENFLVSHSALQYDSPNFFTDGNSPTSLTRLYNHYLVTQHIRVFFVFAESYASR